MKSLAYLGRLFLPLIVITFCGCYSFKGISISPEVETYFVHQFKNNALNAPPTLAADMTNALDTKIRQETRLVDDNTNSDIEFKGSIVDFRVSAEAPQPGEFSSINRLTIVTAVEYISQKNEKDGFKKNFSFFFDFPATTELSTIQTEAIETIMDQLTEDIFNKAFTNW